jgi:hypothetical protein
VSAGAKTINVRALPEAGKPLNFRCCRNFDFKVTPTKQSLKNRESLDLIMALRKRT